MKKINNNIGIDIGSYSIKLSLLDNKKKNIILKDKEIHDSKNLIKDNLIIDIEKFKSIVNNFIKKNNIKNPRLVISLSNIKNCCFSRIFDLNKVKNSELKNAIDIEIEDLIPLEKSEYVYTWTILNKNETKYKILLITLDRKIYDNYVEILSDFKINFVITPNSSLLMNLCVKEKQKNDINLIIDIGHSHSEIIAMRNNIPILIRNVNYGGKIINDSLIRFFNINEDELDVFKNKYLSLIPENEKEKEVFNTICSQIELIIQEINSTILIVKNEYNENVNSILLIGGVSNTKYIDKYIQNSLNINTSLLDFKNLEQNVIFSSSLQSSLFNKKFNNNNITFINKSNFDKYYKKLGIILNSIYLIFIIIIFISIRNKYIENIKNINNIKNELNVYTQTLNEINDKFNEIENQKQIKMAFQQLESNKIDYNLYMKELRTIIPSNLQIDSMEFSNKSIKIKGYSPDYSSVAFYIKELNYDDKFTNCNFTYDNKEKVLNNLKVKVIEFEISINIR